jgi:hypothetical protein
VAGWVGMEGIIGSLQNRDLILPYFEHSMIMEQWPDEYNIKVDSSPYYGHGDGYFHPSTHAKMDERQLYYMFHPEHAGKMVRERRSLMSEMTLSVGSALHAVLQEQMLMAKLIKDRSHIEVEYKNDVHKVRGRLDWLVEHPNGTTLSVEFKTRNQFSYAKQTEPLDSWVSQVNMALDNLDLELGVLIMLEMAWPWRMREFHIHRDQVLIDSIYAKFDRVRAAIAANEPPKHCCPPDSKEMKACPARNECWLAEKAS